MQQRNPASAAHETFWFSPLSKRRRQGPRVSHGDNSWRLVDTSRRQAQRVPHCRPNMQQRNRASDAHETFWGSPRSKTGRQGPRLVDATRSQAEYVRSYPASYDLRDYPYPRTPPRLPHQDDLISPPDPMRVTRSMAAPPRFSHDSSRSRNQGRNGQKQPPPLPQRCSIPYERVGDPRLKIFRLRLPPQFLPLLDTIVRGCEFYASQRNQGWETELFSLTKQDLALRKMKELSELAEPLVQYLKKAVCIMYNVRSITVDRNNPHVKKYSIDTGHTGVREHHDKCDVTVNLALSRSTSYEGGGTFFPDARTAVRLEFGEFLIHPGQLVHSGVHITEGSRYLMVLFANTK